MTNDLDFTENPLTVSEFVDRLDALEDEIRFLRAASYRCPGIAGEIHEFLSSLGKSFEMTRLGVYKQAAREYASS